MPKRGRKFITEFLVPNLNDEKFGARLAWVDRDFSIFQMQWNHKSASFWTEDDCQVFVEWDKKRGHYRPKEKEYFTKSKQRFRAVLNKSIQDNEITQLQSEDKYVKLYFLGPGEAVPVGKILLKTVGKLEDIVKDTNKNDTQTNYLKTECDLTQFTYFLEQDQITNTNFNCNALRDHNYQNSEDHKLLESEYSISCDASKIDLSLYNTLCSDEKNISTSIINISELPNDEGFWENMCFPVLGTEKEHNFLPENNTSTFIYGCYDQVLCPAEACLSGNLMQDNSLEISSKREMEQHSDNRPKKKSKILLYLNKS